jgi:hypothetical protein
MERVDQLWELRQRTMEENKEEIRVLITMKIAP